MKEEIHRSLPTGASRAVRSATKGAVNMHILTNQEGERRKKWFLAIFLAGFMTLAGVGAAFAYWTTSGTGSGNATSGSPSAVTVVQTSTITGLYPGDTVALSGDFNNPNPGKVYITAVTASIGTFSSQTNSGLPACTQADFSITGTSTVGAEINAGSGVGSWSGLSITLNDAGTNQDNCESLSTIPINYTSS